MLRLCGLRLNAVLALRVSDSDGERRLLRLPQGKGAQDRLVPLSPTVLEALRTDWRRYRPTAWLCAGRHGPLSPTVLQKAYTQAKRTAGVTKSGGICGLRHADARHPLAARLPVDDSPANRLVANAILAKAGYQADMAENGRQAVPAVQGKSYGLVLMDVAMPEMDGLEATRAIRQLAGDTGRIPIVALTAGAFTDDRRLCLEAGMNDYLSKPVVRTYLLKVLEHWIGDVAPNATAATPATSPEEPPSLDGEALATEEERGAAPATRNRDYRR